MDGILRSLVIQEPPYDSLVFTVFATAYVVFTAYRYFPTVAVQQPRIYEKRDAFMGYVKFAAWIGLYLPVLYILAPLAFHPASFFWTLYSAGPHLLLLVAQVASEQMSYRYNCTLVIRALVPPLYNARRLFTLYQWIADETKALESSWPGDNALLTWWLVFGLVLAVVNLVFWAYNLFGFLLPIYVPDSLRMHYRLYPTAPREDFITFHEEMVKEGITDFKGGLKAE
eukprot:TRINITY_DN27399_c0_g1_i1.p1 TRINITY_DN27399_c0_g1~~TRINITY_DN27399_c0_g1_i1.p1  ORF type:complete len:227 (+),score=31.11 TRINITY_DN27399_c0_g1_i1:267-947(+)